MDGKTGIRPGYYKVGKIECIEYIEDLGFGDGFCLGNAIKYIARAGRKDARTRVEDLEKAKTYIQMVIDRAVIKDDEQ